MNSSDELETYMKSEGNYVVVDWHLVNALSSAREGSYNEGLYERILEHLIELKVLSQNSNHNYELTNFGLNLNPLLGNGVAQLYFTREKDAREYKKANFSGAMYSVKIRRIENIE